MPSYKWISVFFFVLLGYFALVYSVEAHGSTVCSRQTFHPTDCSPSSSSDEVETNNDDGDDERGNIEEEIPSVIPFS